MPKEANNKKQSKDKKHFMKDFKAELKKVVWPTPKQLTNSTLAVITIVVMIAIIVFVLDFTFEKMNTYGIEKIKSVVETNNNIDSNTVENNTTEETNTSDDETNTVQNSDENQNNTVNE